MSAASEKVQVVVRLDKDVVKSIDHIAVDWEAFRGEAMETLLRVATELITQVRALTGEWTEMTREALERLVKMAAAVIAGQQPLPINEPGIG
jgi:hypothetical protein